MQIVVSNLTFAYPERPDRFIFSDVSATFSAGRVSVIVGPSGSGKSTLLKILAGLVDPMGFSGTVSYGPEALSADQLAAKGLLTLCLQKPACLPWATVIQNVAIGFRLQNRNGYARAADELLHRFGLDDWRFSYPHCLSVGMQARVALARAFVTDPAIVLLDEPFSSLDVAWKEQLYRYLLVAASSAAATTILVTHDLAEALSLADDIFVIRDRSRSLTLSIAENPLKQQAETLSLASVVNDNRFSCLFGTLYDSLTQT